MILCIMRAIYPIATVILQQEDKAADDTTDQKVKGIHGNTAPKERPLRMIHKHIQQTAKK